MSFEFLTIQARIIRTVVDILFAFRALESDWTLTHVRPHKISASGSILTRRAIALVDFRLAVASGESFIANATVLLSNVFTRSVVAEFVQRDSFPQRSIDTGDHFHVAEHSIPPRRALTFELVLCLLAFGFVEAWRGLAPVDVVFASFSSVAVRAVAFVVSN